jgi:hypothetical protein
MDTSEFVGHVKQIRLDSIEPSLHNPRGAIERDASFERLVASIDRVGILVPMVVRELSSPRGHIKYELVDGERRYLAAKELGRPEVPAHILREKTGTGDLRQVMFHLHMTREQWDPMAQCRSLVDSYPKLGAGLKFDEKPVWTKRLAEETGMPSVTARDRIHVLAWPKELKDNFFRFDEAHPSRDIYSYVLAIEASIVEKSRFAFPQFFNGGTPVEVTANEVRGSLLTKTLSGIETGAVTSREQIRDVEPLFSKTLDEPKKRIALALFRDLVKRKDFHFDDVKAEITTRLPELLEERPPKPRRVIAAISSLARTLKNYDPAYIESATVRVTARKKLKEEFRSALDELVEAAKNLRTKL